MSTTKTYLKDATELFARALYLGSNVVEEAEKKSANHVVVTLSDGTRWSVRVERAARED